MRILGLSGQQGAGKDFAYGALKLMLGEHVMRMAFADGVRREVTVEVLSAFPNLAIGNTDGAGVWAKPYTEGQRWLLQQWGTEFRRAQDPDYWVKYGLDYIEQRYSLGQLWCVTDVRFANEAEAIRDVGGVVARVVADDAVRAARLGLSVEALEERSQHASEVIDFSADYIISNNGDLLLPPDLLTWLGLPSNCIKCQFADRHIWHDNGEAFEWS